MVNRKLIKDKTKLLSSVGLAYRAGKISVGLDIVCNDIRSGKTKLVIMTSDSSLNTRKKISDCTGYYNIEAYDLEIEMSELGGALGKSDISCVSINDTSFVKLINKYID